LEIGRIQSGATVLERDDVVDILRDDRFPALLLAKPAEGVFPALGHA
jgi:hypothetical protein